jgi:hypothetical protein
MRAFFMLPFMVSSGIHLLGVDLVLVAGSVFKTVCDVVILRWVGSIPTYSRHHSHPQASCWAWKNTTLGQMTERGVL